MNTITVGEIRNAKTQREAGVFASYEFFNFMKEKIADFPNNQKLLPLAITDYGGDFFDYAVIRYCAENNIRDFWYEETIWNGYNAFLVITDDQLKATNWYILDIFEDFEEFYYNLEYNIIQDEISRLFSESPSLRFYSRDVMHDVLAHYGHIIHNGQLDYDFDFIVKECQRRNGMA